MHNPLNYTREGKFDRLFDYTFTFGGCPTQRPLSPGTVVQLPTQVGTYTGYTYNLAAYCQLLGDGDQASTDV